MVGRHAQRIADGGIVGVHHAQVQGGKIFLQGFVVQRQRGLEHGFFGKGHQADAVI